MLMIGIKFLTAGGCLEINAGADEGYLSPGYVPLCRSNNLGIRNGGVKTSAPMMTLL